MENEFEFMTLTEDISEEELCAFTSRVYMEKWKTSYDYRCTESIPFKSKKIDPKILANNEFMAFSLYISHLTDKALEYRFDSLEGMVGKEFKEWDRRGGMCIYISVVHYCLLLESRIIDEQNIKLIQGYYSHPTHGILSLISNLQNQAGIHAFISINGSVIDFSIKQEESTFDFPNHSFILGDIPEGMNLGGWPEGKDVAKQYGREIARFSGLNYYDWIDKHLSYAYKIAIENLERELEELGDG
jgi:hypothetical protein